ncbi:fungal-specific transcription factor domain-containing protein [Phaeosphaeriaceae sp. PMI808]|nr:fungal-specific transcription factor domain-containing protein [Phaeosphaeriaceae sp. PMI808]
MTTKDVSHASSEDKRNPLVGWTPVIEMGSHSKIAPANLSPDVDSSEQTSPPTKRRREDKERTRVSRACDRCKKKKTRCSGRCPCALCLRSRLPCEFTASYTRGRLPSVIVDETAMSANANLQISPLEQTSTPDTSRKDSSATAFQFPGIYPSPSTDHSIFGQTERPNTTGDEAPNPPSHSSPEPARGQTDQQGHYIGSSSAVSFLLRIQKRLNQNSSFSHDSSIFTFGDAPLPEFDPSFFVLPPKPDAQRLVERYFDYAAPTHRFLHRPTIEKLVEEFYETQGDMRSKEDAPAKTALLLIVFAQAQAYMPPGSTSKDNSTRYFFAAEHQLAKERGAVRLASVQARLLQCFYLLTQSRINHCWSLFGTLSHMAFAIGLNRGRRCDPSGTVDYVELESRRRLFWVAYSLDKYLAAALGRPRTFKDEDIDQELPTIVDDTDLLPNYINPTPANAYSLMTAPVEHIKLTRIVSLVLRDLYSLRPPSLAHRIELSSKYTSELHTWRSSLSRFLNDDEGRSIDSHLLIPIYQRQRSVLHISYCHTMLLIHRPFLLSNFASLTHMPTHSTFAPNASIDTSANIASCLEAAMSIVRDVDDVFTSSNLFRSFWFTQYYAFCAVVVLYVYCIQQHLIAPGTCEEYFAAGQKCQRQLESVSETDCLARRYCLVLDELRLEAIRQTKSSDSLSTTTPLPFRPAPDSITVDKPAAVLPLLPVESDTSADPNAPFFAPGNMSTPDSAVFNPSFLPNSNIMADLTSWGQFDSLVTAGIGLFDSAGMQGDANFGYGFGL